MGARSDQVRRLERFRSILRHDEFSEEVENRVLDALSKRIAPLFGQAFGHIDDLLVQIIRSVDDGQRIHGM